MTILDYVIVVGIIALAYRKLSARISMLEDKAGISPGDPSQRGKNRDKFTF